ncbi:hypothetical protein BHM03_00053602 [Ensete ventricosum]|nr:hypothetical protein BHM03_00053602 [Ensete ventricosum]
MAEVRARAPGKIILSGEHAVVHGSTAVAAAIDLYTHVSFRLDPPLPPAITLYGLTSSAHVTGGMIQFRSGELTHIKSSSPLRMLITNTKVGRNTKALVAGVSERASRHPDAMASVFTAVDFVSKELSAIIQSPAQDDISITAREEKIEELMEMNQGLLQCMGVSHAAIEMVLRITLKYKLASKLTGAGGGGCVLTLMPTCMLLVLCHLIKS